MMVSTSYKFVYFAPGKTGTSSVAKILKKYYGADDVGFDDRDWKRHHIGLPVECENYFTFITVRNPYTRFLSAYNFFSSKDESIEQFVRDTWFRPITEEMFMAPRTEGWLPIRLDMILRAETLERDFNHLPFLEQQHIMPVVNVTPHVKLDRLPSIAYHYVRERHALDFKVFGYDMDKPFSYRVKLL